MKNNQNYSKAISGYLTGGALAAILTSVVYLVVVERWLAGPWLAAFALICAGAQLTVHLIFFLHLRTDEKPRWNIISFTFTVFTALIIVIGSLWIMMNLNYNMGVTSQQMDTYMIQQAKNGF